MTRLSPTLRITSLLFVALAASCMGDGSSDSQVVAALTSGATSATVATSSDWGTGYCANVTVSNAGSSPTTSWTVVINLNQATVSSLWSASQTTSGSTLTVTPLSYNAAIAPGSSVSFGYCANASGSNYHPTITSVSGTGTGGTVATGGTRATGGTTATGGTVATGGTRATGGTTGTGGTVGTGGTRA